MALPLFHFIRSSGHQLSISIFFVDWSSFPGRCTGIANGYPAGRQVGQLDHALVMKNNFFQRGNPAVSGRNGFPRMKLPRAVALLVYDQQDRLAFLDDAEGRKNYRITPVGKRPGIHRFRSTAASAALTRRQLRNYRCRRNSAPFRRRIYPRPTFRLRNTYTRIAPKAV